MTSQLENADALTRMRRAIEAHVHLHEASADRSAANVRYQVADTEFRAAWAAMTPAEQKRLQATYPTDLRRGEGAET